MALNSKLEKFTKQQEKVQATLTKVARSAKKPNAAATAATATTTAAAAAPPAQPQVPLAQRFTFANDKDKLQQIAIIQRSPTMAQVKRVLDLLLETRQALLPEDIHSLCFVDVKQNKDVFENLKANVKVAFDGQRFSYKPKHELKNQKELLVQIRKCTEGISLADLKDAYPGILSDVQELKASNEIWVLMNTDSQEDILYPNDPRVKIKVEDDIKRLIRSIEMPTDFMLVERELQKAGMKPFSNTMQKRETIGVPNMQRSTKQKKKRHTKRTKYTNEHLMELFQNM